MIVCSRRICAIAAMLLGTSMLWLLWTIDVSPGGWSRQVNIFNISSRWLQQNSTTACINTTTNPTFYVCPYNRSRDRYISGALLSGGVWEAGMTRLFQQALQLYPGATVVDLGANIGYYSLLAASMGHCVVAVEPVVQNVIKLSTAAIINKLEEKIVILRNAVSADRGDAVMSTSTDNQGGLRVLGEAGVGDPAAAVAVITLDDITEHIHTRHVVVKVDIEGHECKALDKTRTLFARFDVPYIFMEWQRLTALQYITSSACPPRAVTRLAATLARAGYLAHDMKFHIQLDPSTANRWKADDVYWRHSSAPNLTQVARHILVT